MAGYLNPHAYYKSLSIPILNYIHFRKWYSIGQIAGGSKDDLIRLKQVLEIFEKGKDEQKAAVQKANIEACKHLIKAGIKPFDLATICLLKSMGEEDLEESALIERTSFFYSAWGDRKPNLKKISDQVAEKIGQELVFHKLEKGDWVEDKFRTVYERNNFRAIKKAVVFAYEKSFVNHDESALYKELSKVLSVQSAKEQERNIPHAMLSNLAMLRQQGYQIYSAMDFYIAVQTHNKVISQLESKK